MSSRELIDNGFRALACHRDLEYLNVIDCRGLSYDVISETVPTLPSLKWFVLTRGYSERYTRCVTRLRCQMPYLNVRKQLW